MESFQQDVVGPNHYDQYEKVQNTLRFCKNQMQISITCEDILGIQNC